MATPVSGQRPLSVHVNVGLSTCAVPGHTPSPICPCCCDFRPTSSHSHSTRTLFAGLRPPYTHRHLCASESCSTHKNKSRQRGWHTLLVPGDKRSTAHVHTYKAVMADTSCYYKATCTNIHLTLLNGCMCILQLHN